MKRKTINKIFSLILTNEEISEEQKRIIERQWAKAKVAKTDHYVNNRYWEFSVNRNANAIFSVAFRILDVYFWDLTQNFPVHCILDFKDGYITALEVYTPDGSLFETIDMENIDVKLFSPRNNQAVKEKIAEIINSWDPLGLFPAAPKDEYHSEVSEVLRRFEGLSSNREKINSAIFGESIHVTFQWAFGDVFTKSIEECEKIARKILEAIAS